MRKFDLLAGLAAFLALAVLMPLAALEPVPAGTDRAAVRLGAACGATFADVCERGF